MLSTITQITITTATLTLDSFLISFSAFSEEFTKKNLRIIDDFLFWISSAASLIKRSSQASIARNSSFLSIKSTPFPANIAATFHEVWKAA